MSLNFGTDLFKYSAQYDDSGALITAGGVNVFERATYVDQASATSAYIPYLIDGNLTTGISTGSTSADWFRLDLGAIKTGFVNIFYEAVKTNLGGGTVTATLETSTDATSWTSQGSVVASMAGVGSTSDNILKRTIKASYYRLTVTLAGGSTGYGAIREAYKYLT